MLERPERKRDINVGGQLEEACGEGRLFLGGAAVLRIGGGVERSGRPAQLGETQGNAGMPCGLQVVVVWDHVRGAKIEVRVAGEGNHVDLPGEEIEELPGRLTRLAGEVALTSQELELESGTDLGPGRCGFDRGIQLRPGRDETVEQLGLLLPNAVNLGTDDHERWRVLAGDRDGDIEELLSLLWVGPVDGGAHLAGNDVLAEEAEPDHRCEFILFVGPERGSKHHWNLTTWCLLVGPAAVDAEQTARLAQALVHRDPVGGLGAWEIPRNQARDAVLSAGHGLGCGRSDLGSSSRRGLVGGRSGIGTSAGGRKQCDDEGERGEAGAVV